MQVTCQHAAPFPDVWCEAQDHRSFPVLAQAAENLMRVGSDSTDDDADQ